MEGFIQIYRAVDGTTTPLKEVTLSKRSYWHHELGGQDYVMLFFTLGSDNLAVTTPFKEGDFIINPINGDKYFLMDLAVPNENSSGFWDFQLRFDSIITTLSRNICKYTLQGGIPELSWKLTDNMNALHGEGTSDSVLVQAIKKSLEYDGITQSGNWLIDTFTYAAGIDFSEQFSYSLNGEKYTELFDKICENYGCEWWNEKETRGVVIYNVIYFGISRTAKGTEIDFVDTVSNEQDHQLQIISTSTQKSGEEYATKLYYRGSERNVPRNYNLSTGEKMPPVSYLNDSRLPLPDNTPFISSSDFADKPHACIELYETNDDIYPRRLEIVTNVLYYTGTNDQGDIQRFYCVKTNNPIATITGFDVDASKGNLSLAFSSGSLNGRTYEVQLHKTSLSRAKLFNLDGTEYEGSKSGCWYEIVSDGGSEPTPNEFLYPEVGNECQLFNWKAYDKETNTITAPMLQLIADAREELYAAAQERFAEICNLNTSFTCVPAKVGVPSSLLLGIGQAVNIHTAPAIVGASFSSRIRAVEVMLYNENDRTYTVGIGAKYSKLGRIINSLRENREDLKSVEEVVGKQTSPTTFRIREKYGFQAIRQKKDGTYVPDTLSFDVVGVTGKTEINYTDRFSIRIKADNGSWVAPDSEGEYQLPTTFETITAAAFLDDSLEDMRATITLNKIEDGSSAAALVVTNPLCIFEVNEDWDVGYAFADDVDTYKTEFYCFAKDSNLPLSNINIYLEATNGNLVQIVTNGVGAGNTTINGAPILVTFLLQNNKATLEIKFTSASVEQLFSIPVLFSMDVTVGGSTSEIEQTANIVFRQRGEDGTDGTDGSAASVRKLIVSPDYIVADASGNLLNRQLTFKGQISVGNGLPSALTDAKFKAIIDGNISSNISSPFTLPVACQSVTIEMYDETGYTLLDSQSVSIVQQGGTGKDAVTVILSNENHTLSYEDDRDVINYSGSGTIIKLVTAEYELTPKEYGTYPENERPSHLQPGEFFVHADATDITAGTRTILGNTFSFGNARSLVGGTTGRRAAYIDFTIYFRAIGETQINSVVKRQNFSVAPSGYNVTIITLYKRSAEELAETDFTDACAAATPEPIAAIRYNFITKSLSNLPDGWTSTMPSNNEEALWTVQATARSRTDEDSVAVTEFSSPTKILPSGLNTVLTAHSSSIFDSSSNQLALEIVDEDGLHTIQNGFKDSETRPDSSASGALKVFELDKSSLDVLSTKIINIYEDGSHDSFSTYLSSVADNSIVAVCAYGNVVPMFSKYQGAESLDTFLATLGCPRFRLFNGEGTVTTMETFAFIGGKFVTKGAGILDIHAGSVKVSAFVKDGVFVNGQLQLKSETVTLYGRFANKAAAMASYGSIGTLTYKFSTHSLTSLPDGWSQEFPEAGENNYPCFMLQATASNVNEIDEILGDEWSVPQEYVKNGDNPPSFLWSSAFIQVNLDKDGSLMNEFVSEFMQAYLGGTQKTVNSALRLVVDGRNTPLWTSTDGIDELEAVNFGIEPNSSNLLTVSDGLLNLMFSFKSTKTETAGTERTLTAFFTILDANNIAQTYSSSIKIRFVTGNYPGENATKLELIASKVANLPFKTTSNGIYYSESSNVADPSTKRFKANYTGANFCVKKYSGDTHVLFTDESAISVSLVGNFTTEAIASANKYSTQPDETANKEKNYLYLQDGDLYVHIGDIPGERCIQSGTRYIVFPPSTVGVAISDGALSTSTVLTIDYNAVWSELKISDDEISSSVTQLDGKYTNVQQLADLLSFKLGNDKTQERRNLLSNAYVNRVFETSTSSSDSQTLGRVSLQAGHWYILSAEAFEQDTLGKLQVYLNIDITNTQYVYEKEISSGVYRAAVIGFSSAVFERKATLFKMGTASIETQVVARAVYASSSRKCILKYVQVEDVTELIDSLSPAPSSEELGSASIMNMNFDVFALKFASSYSLGPEDYSVNPGLLTINKIFTVDSIGNTVGGTTEEVKLPNGVNATAYDLSFTNATGTVSASYYKELQALKKDNGSDLEVGKTYTMSFWAKGNMADIDNVSVFLSYSNYCYPAASPAGAYGYQGINSHRLHTAGDYWYVDQNEWRYYQITFTILKNPSSQSGDPQRTDYGIFLRNYGGAVKIACPKLEAGGRATEFNDGVSVKQLLATGVDILNQKIIATANVFSIQNNQGQKTFTVDQNGNLVAENNAYIKGNILLYGFTLRQEQHITDDNISSFSYETTPVDKRPYKPAWKDSPMLSFIKTGNNIIYEANQRATIFLPCFSGENSITPYWKQFENFSKRFVGTKVLIRNKSSESPIQINGLFLNSTVQMTEQVLYGISPSVLTIQPGHFIELHCKHVAARKGVYDPNTGTQYETEAKAAEQGITYTLPCVMTGSINSFFSVDTDNNHFEMIYWEYAYGKTYNYTKVNQEDPDEQWDE